MDFYHINDAGQIILFTETSRQKWLDLQKCQQLALCILHLEKGQIIAQDSTETFTFANNPELSQFYWDNYVDQYWRDFYIALSTKDELKHQDIPNNFGIIVTTPNLWEVLDMNPDDYLKSIRTQHHLLQDKWHTSNLKLT